MSAAFSYLGQYARALQSAQQALAIAQELKDEAQTAIVLNSIGGIYRNLGQYSLALEHFQQALTLLRQIGDRTQEGTILNNIGAIYINLKQYPQALAALKDALAVQRELGNRIPVGVTLNNIGAIYLDLGEPEQALEFHQQALVVAREVSDCSGEWFALNNIGTAYMYLKQYTQALSYLQASLAIARTIGDRAGQGITLVNIGSTLFQEGQVAAAEEACYDALEILETLRQSDLSDTHKVSLFETQLQAYQFLQDVLVSQANPEKQLKALEVAERGRARAFVELLANQLSDQQARALAASAPTIASIQQIAQQQNAVLVQYSLINNVDGSHLQLYIWVVQPTGDISFHSTDLANLDQPLSELVHLSRAMIGARGRKISSASAQINSKPDVEPTHPQPLLYPFQQLYDLLIRPIRDQFPSDSTTRVIVIPQAELFLVPFAALQDEQGTCLIQQHTVLIAPSIQVLAMTHQRRQELSSLYDQTAVAPDTVLIVGNPTMPTSPTIPPLMPLPEAQREAEMIAALFNAKVYTGANATKKTIVQQMPQARLIHLATHGLLEYSVTNPAGIHTIPGALALAPEPDSNNPADAATSVGQNGLLTAAEIAELSLGAELVVLSACDTGRGTITGDGVIGLSRSLIAAGVPSVIVSLWKVPDKSTAYLMTQFYQNLLHQSDKAQALRQAMLSTRQQYPHPQCWAAFTLVGQAD
ncbi:CHAT domain-containing protein [Leptolyngbya sp. 7M]|nr:CHAT domain-containing protein [Leptolyngbya sp. 7M]